MCCFILVHSHILIEWCLTNSGSRGEEEEAGGGGKETPGHDAGERLGLRCCQAMMQVRSLASGVARPCPVNCNLH